MSNTKTKFRVVKGWDVSTTNIPFEDDQIIEAHLTENSDKAISLCCTKTEYGYMFYPTDKIPVGIDGLSSYFCQIYNDAVDAGVEWLRFDCDAEVNDDYTRFEW